MTSFSLNTGQHIPAVGLGTWRSGPNQVAEAVEFALRNGCRHIDAALRYGNESEVGRGIKASGVPRDQIFLTTKLWNTYHNRVKEGIEESLANLGTDYLDLYLIHWPVSLPADASNTVEDKVLSGWDFINTWAEMQKLVEQGLVRAIGVSNFTPSHLERLLSAPSTSIVPAVDQVELHLLNPQPELYEYCTKKNIHLTAYSPLGSQDSPLYSLPELKEVAKKLDKTVAQVLLAWGIKKGWSVIPKSVSPTRILENLGVEFNLPDEDFAVLEAIKERKRLIHGQDFLPVKVFD
ncbi:NADP-dependent oxidoreductase domain-containing protein [Dactylonectria estremocensis]|uniref:NADP-dependent oxidoreductase domain-containing protein n=1 Tax=Dactylonectria estremocensis TaxID=1079267 RepID=A0A9P9IX45_9HYPO|nr:NADP-dependent oxidoreductase domain-containing protein [Dactylonectria estremocensis]